jgi:hypothetical protein
VSISLPGLQLVFAVFSAVAPSSKGLYVMPCACESGCVDGGALGQFAPSAVQVLTESADPNARIFPWSMPARYYQRQGRMVIYGTCLVAGTTRKGDTFSKDELERHGCTLIHGPIEAFAHSWEDGGDHWLAYPENVILDAEEVDGELQYIAGVEDAGIKKALGDKEITGVSVNTICRRVPADNLGVCQGMILNGFCLLSKDSTPASPGTNVKVWNCLRVNPRRLGTGKTCSCSKSEGKVGEKTSDNNAGNPPKPNDQVPVTAQVTGFGPAAGVVEPSIEERVKVLEETVKNSFDSVWTHFTGVDAKLDTLIATMPAMVVASVPTQEEKDKQAQKDRSQKYGIGVKDGGNVTKPGEFASIPEDQFADPVNFRYPADAEHCKAALGYFNQPDNRSQYSPEEQAKIMQKIVAACVSNGVEVSWQPNDAAYDALPEELKAKLSGYTKKTQQAGPVAATVPVDKLPPPVITVKVEEIEAIVQDRALFTPALKLRGILNLCEQKRAEVV